MTIPAPRRPAAPAQPQQSAAMPTDAQSVPFGGIRFPALAGVLAGSAAVRAPKATPRAPKESDLPPLLRKAAFED